MGLAGKAIAGCPPQFAAGFVANGNNARYQLKTTVNSTGGIWPQVNNPDTAVGDIPAKVPVDEFDEQCSSLALGQEINIFDAGEISVFTLTAKTMAERMLRPAYFEENGIINCIDTSCIDTSGYPSGSGERCGDYPADVIDDPTTWKNTSTEVKNVANLYPGVYEY